ncbi:Exocyst complex component 5 [Mycoemilia scoparia]|uniref:Exocyst complex component 5 n=1 Tax=Mycoemilia scoparia TaxID=417184 RepID=A0A9W8A6F9_9FUNG|nr:Exocyst complex component 5 [Mycoemilia scoparia]
MSLQLNPQLRKKLTAKDFEGKFSATDFIEDITGNLVRDAGNFGNKFDPKSFIRIFDFALKDVTKVKEELDDQIKALEEEKRACETAHQNDVKQIKSQFVAIGARMESLEIDLGQMVGDVARIGEQLDIISREKFRAEEINELITFFSELSDDKIERLNELLGSGLEGQMKAAQVLRRLIAMTAENEYVSQSNIKGKTHIQKYSEEFENFVMKQFHDAYEKNNTQLMAVAAAILDKFNGGKSVIKAYINQHPFFLESMSNDLQHQIEEISSKTVGAASQLDGAQFHVDKWLSQLLDSTYRVIKEEWSTISQIFPKPVIVIKRFIRRIFEETIQSYLGKLLTKAREYSNLSYLRTVHSSHAATRNLVERLKLFDIQVVTPTIAAMDMARRICGNNEDRGNRLTRLNRGFANPAFSQTIGGSKKDDEASMAIREISVALSGKSPRSGEVDQATGILHATLDQCLDELFVSYIEGNRYIRDEQSHLNEALKAIIDVFSKAKVEKKPGTKSQGLFSSMWSSSGSPIGHSPTYRAQVDQKDKAQFQPDDTFCSLAQELSVKVFKIHSESVSRSVETVRSSELSQTIIPLFKQAMTIYSTDFVLPLIDDMEKSLRDSRIRPNVDILKLVQVINRAIILIQIHFQKVLAPLVTGSHTAYQDIVAIKNSTMHRLESEVNTLVIKLIQASTQWISFTLSKQKKTDFQPSEDNLMALSSSTEPCNDCTEYLSMFCEYANSCFDTQNRTRILAELGNTVHQILSAHYTKFVVSIIGGLVVSNDMSRYRQVIEKFGSPQLSERFDYLRELAKIYMVNAESLKGLLNEGILSTADPNLIKKFVLMREDYRSANLSKLLE